MFSVGSFQEGLKEVWKSDDDQMMKKNFHKCVKWRTGGIANIKFVKGHMIGRLP